MKKPTFASRTGGVKTLECKECKAKVHNVDTKADAVTCWKCVDKSLNPRSAIISDMSKEELERFFKKQKKNGRSEN